MGVLEIEVLNSVKSTSNDEYIYIPTVPAINEEWEYSDSERVLIFAKEIKNVEGNMFAMPVMKDTGGNNGIFRL